MRIVILSTMLADRRGTAEWGFSALAEAPGQRLLFDTGARDDTVLRNAAALGVDLASVTDVVLSHGHWDHTGGLVALRRTLRGTNPEAMRRAHVGPGFFVERYRGGKPFSLSSAARAEYEGLGGSFIEHAGPGELWPGIHLTGPVPRVHSEGTFPRDILVGPDGAAGTDEVPEDQSLVFESPEGPVVLTGCGHAGIVNTLEAATRLVGTRRIGAVVGGLHLFEASDAAIDWTGEQFRRLGVAHVLGTHCTGIEALIRLRSAALLDRRTCAVGAVGATYESGKGIDPGLLAR